MPIFFRLRRAFPLVNPVFTTSKCQKKIACGGHFPLEILFLQPQNGHPVGYSPLNRVYGRVWLSKTLWWSRFEEDKNQRRVFCDWVRARVGYLVANMTGRPGRYRKMGSAGSKMGSAGSKMGSAGSKMASAGSKMASAGQMATAGEKITIQGLTKHLQGEIRAAGEKNLTIWGRKNRIYKGGMPAAGEFFFAIWGCKNRIYKGKCPPQAKFFWHFEVVKIGFTRGNLVFTTSNCQIFFAYGELNIMDFESSEWEELTSE